MARKKKGGGDLGEGANWMDTYGDMVTLLLCFFVILFSFSSVDAEKWEALVGALTGQGTNIIPNITIEQVLEPAVQLDVTSYGTYGDSQHEPSNPDSGNAQKDMENFLKIVNSLTAFVDENGIDAEIIPEPEHFRVTLRIQDNIFFDSGVADLKPEALPLIGELGELIAANMDIIDAIDIEGHTDTDPIFTSKYKDNWDLSAERADNTVRELIKNTGIVPAKLRPMGLSEYHPIADNNTPEGKYKNRRVDFVITGMISGEQ